MMKHILLFLALLSSPLYATELDIEAGGVSNPYNRVAIPGDEGTAFDLSKALSGRQFYHRLSLSHRFSRHGVRFLYAPLRLTGSATYNKDIDFLGVNFSRGNKTDFEYQFNSYRASWFYQIDEEGAWQTRLGVTAKIRDAKTKAAQGNVNKVKRNTGIVPLFYLYSSYEFNSGLRVALDFDGWAAPQGRAFDTGLILGYAILPKLDLNLGYRILEGGVDNDTVYNFSRIEYLFSSLRWEF